MNVAVLGTGVVAKSLAGKLASMGHAVKMGTRDPKATLARNEADMAGGPPIRTWLETQKNVKLVPFTEVATDAELVVNGLSGSGALEGLKLVGAKALAGKVMIDISNPLDFSKGMPPSLLVANHDSLGEQIQRAYPDTKVVKTLNTVNAFLMTNPASLAGGDHSMIVAGNDAGAKATVTRLLNEFGWKDVVDLGDITMARGTEMYVPLWARLFGALKTPQFNVKIVR